MRYAERKVLTAALREAGSASGSSTNSVMILSVVLSSFSSASMPVMTSKLVSWTISMDRPSWSHSVTILLLTLPLQAAWILLAASSVDTMGRSVRILISAGGELAVRGRLGLRLYSSLRFSASASFSSISVRYRRSSAALRSFMSSAIFLALLTSSAQEAATCARCFSRACCAANALSSLLEPRGVALAKAARSLTCSACAARSASLALRSSSIEARRRCWATWWL